MENIIIENDFGVDFISKTEGTKLFVGVKNLYYHIVAQSKENEYFNLRQAHIHRFEVAKLVDIFLTENKKSLVNSEIKTLSNGVKVEISLFEANVELKLKLSDKDYSLPFLFLNAPHYKILTDDLNLLNEIQTIEVNKPNYKNKLLQNLLNDKSNELSIEINILTDTEYQLILFEMMLLKKRRKWLKDFGVYKIYSVMLRSHIELPSNLKNLLLENFEFFLINDSCDCDSEGCFFDILKKSQLLYFNEKNLVKDGKMDVAKIESRFKNFWNEISLKQRALLLFLDGEFHNTPLLNMAFWHKDFDLNEYIRLMCSPYQPDSDDEQWIRTISSLANYFIKIH